MKQLGNRKRPLSRRRRSRKSPPEMAIRRAFSFRAPELPAASKPDLSHNRLCLKFTFDGVPRLRQRISVALAPASPELVERSAALDTFVTSGLGSRGEVVAFTPWRDGHVWPP